MTGPAEPGSFLHNLSGIEEAQILAREVREVREDRGQVGLRDAVPAGQRGADLVDRFSEAAPGVHLVQVEVFDPVTGAGGYVYFWSRDAGTAQRIRTWMTAG